MNSAITSVLIISLLSAVSCWAFAGCLIYILFKPYSIKSILGVKYIGYLPKNRKILIRGIAEKIKTTLNLQKQNIDAYLHSEKLSGQIVPQIEVHIEEFLKTKLPQQIPMLGMLIGEKTIQQIKEIFVNEIKILLPQVLSDYIQHALNDQDLQKNLESKLNDIISVHTIQETRRSFSNMVKKIKLSAFIFGAVFALILTSVYLLFT